MVPSFYRKIVGKMMTIRNNGTESPGPRFMHTR
jgi:hypothetical protein